MPDYNARRKNVYLAPRFWWMLNQMGKRWFPHRTERVRSEAIAYLIMLKAQEMGIELPEEMREEEDND